MPLPMLVLPLAAVAAALPLAPPPPPHAAVAAALQRAVAEQARQWNVSFSVGVHSDARGGEAECPKCAATVLRVGWAPPLVGRGALATQGLLFTPGGPGGAAYSSAGYNLAGLYAHILFPTRGSCSAYAGIVHHCLNGWTCGNIAAAPGDVARFYADLFEQHSSH
eukprot:gene23372-57944_t